MGTKIDLEDDLGFDDNVSLAQVSGYWRFAKRHRPLAGYYAFNRDASKVLTEQIHIGDKLFDVGVSVNSNWEIDFFQVSYADSFIQTPKWEVSGSLGLYYLDTSITFRIVDISAMQREDGLQLDWSLKRRAWDCRSHYWA